MEKYLLTLSFIVISLIKYYHGVKYAINKIYIVISKV